MQIPQVAGGTPKIWATKEIGVELCRQRRDGDGSKEVKDEMNVKCADRSEQCKSKG